MLDELEISGVIDTNILVYAHLKGSDRDNESFVLLDGAIDDRQRFEVTPQILMEFYSVITDSRRVTVPYSSAEARSSDEIRLH